MTLLEIVTLINEIAGNQVNVSNVVKTGDIYDLNTDNSTQKFSAFCATQKDHTYVSGDFVQFNFIFFYVDRLTEDKHNKVEVQSTGINVLMNILKTLELQYGLEISVGNFTTFTERFEAECAGVYTDIGITGSIDYTCYE